MLAQTMDKGKDRESAGVLNERQAVGSRWKIAIASTARPEGRKALPSEVVGVNAC